MQQILTYIRLPDGYDVGLDFSDPRIAGDTQLQEQICEDRLRY